MLRTPHLAADILWDTEMATLIIQEATTIRSMLYPQEADILDFQMQELKNSPFKQHEDDPAPWVDLTRYRPPESDDPNQWDQARYGFTADTCPRGYDELNRHLTRRGCRFIMDIHGLLSSQYNPMDVPQVEPEHELMLARLWTTHLVMVHGVQANHLYMGYDTQHQNRFDAFYRAHNLKLDMR